FLSSRRRHTRFSRDWSSDVCSSDLVLPNTDILESTGISRNSMRRTWVVNYASSGYADYSPEYGGRGLGSAAITAWGFSIYEPSEIGRASGRARGEGALVDEAVA